MDPDVGEPLSLIQQYIFSMPVAMSDFSELTERRTLTQPTTFPSSLQYAGEGPVLVVPNVFIHILEQQHRQQFQRQGLY